jgi:hypothetical protein
MYKVDYYTLAKFDDGSIGNVRQYSDIYYTDVSIGKIPTILQDVIDVRKGLDKYVPVITRIEFVKGHLNR